MHLLMRSQQLAVDRIYESIFLASETARRLERTTRRCRIVEIDTVIPLKVLCNAFQQGLSALGSKMPIQRTVICQEDTSPASYASWPRCRYETSNAAVDDDNDQIGPL